MNQYYLDNTGAFVIEDYQHAKLFADFFPGVAGLYGIPTWAFYVNRGQAVGSFGIESKDKAILEFQPANKAYRLTSIQGFRTFLKINDGTKQKFYEPFSNSVLSPFKVRQRMLITSHDLTIEEINTTLGLKVVINYFTMPEEPFAALVRRVSIENTGRKKLDIQCVDGLPAINPYGLKDWLGKHLGRTVEAWVAVRNIQNKAPYYQFKVEVADTPQVTPICEGNFYFAFDSDSRSLLDMIVEASCVFGYASDFSAPENFLREKDFSLPKHQETTNRTPSAMSFSRFVLCGQKKHDITAIAGFAHDLAELKKVVVKSKNKSYIEDKARRNRQIIDEIKGYCSTHSSSNEFDQYCGQNFLDNILRGGLPISLQTAEGPVSFNVYSRKHGDLERDYNFFMLAATYLSQGNGNYRDVNQNRRNDIWFNPDVKDSSLVNFLNLIQADGYNPLVVKGAIFVVKDDAAIEEICHEFDVLEDADKLKETLKKGYMPGELLKFVTREIAIKGKPDDFLTKVLGVSAKHESADPGEGFWSDHWTYNLDLIESYLGLYPEKLKELVLEKRIFNFFLNDFYVLPREARLVLTPAGVRQYHSLSEHDKEVKAKAKGYKLRGDDGQGEVYTTSLLVKLICILANKAASLDPSGIGIEMEANKPNWYDALNGLPGLLGSSISETFEVKRLAVFVKKSLEQLRLDDHVTVLVFEELVDFIQALTHVLSSESEPLKYWQKSNDLKEHYRHAVRYGIRGQEKFLTIPEIKKFLDGIIEKCDTGITQARYDNGLFATYFYHEVIEYDLLDRSHHGHHHVRAKAFKRHDLPLFLEGFVHALRTQTNSENASILYKAVKSSPVYDRALKMYKVNTDLSKESDEIGRTRIFPSGWLENESVWLHMEYKYFLELLRHGLPKEFFAEIKGSLVPFLDPAMYGRSILQNSSFIASSAHEDKNLHGQGFVARLSGSTAEFLHIWLIMNMGVRPFTLDAQGRLTLSFNPLLPSWLFTTKAQEGYPAHTYAFKLFAKILVVYHNPFLKDTFGSKAARAQKTVLTYPGRKSVEVSGGVLEEASALDVREGKVDRIDVYFS
ncbi:MAG: cellobiose phosphorylase [Candidatus Omnitrophica bacterium]|nr:cellobiose phosphorylase [Candidatus Omnitrophota bacterium]